MPWTLRTLPLALLLACGKPGDTTASESAATTAETTHASSSTATTSSTTATATSASSTSDSMSTTSTSTTATSSSSTGTTTGGACSQQGEPCDAGQKCCDALECCAGVPVPPGQEFCGETCPISDRAAKTDLRPIDPGDILARVVALDITTWRYKKDAVDVRHLGPMAQDFRAAFGLWDTDRMIFPLDAAGVSLAAIQGLHRRLAAAEAENDDLRRRLDRLERHLAAANQVSP